MLAAAVFVLIVAVVTAAVVFLLGVALLVAIADVVASSIVEWRPLATLLAVVTLWRFFVIFLVSV